MIIFNSQKVRDYINKKNEELVKEYKPISKSVSKTRKCLYSNNSFAKEAGINKGSFQSIMLKNYSPRICIAYKIAKIMGITIEDLLIIKKWGD